MKWHDFIFSNRPAPRISRHLLFWILWWLYFWGSVYVVEQPYDKNSIAPSSYWNWGSNDIARSIAMLFVHMVGTYSLLYLLMPGYLLKAKYLHLAVGIILLILLIIAMGFLMTTTVFPVIDQLANPGISVINTNRAWTGFNTGLLSAIKVFTAAAAIKLVKYRMQKEREYARLEKEKIEAELILLKAQIRPGFLFNALNNIYAYSLSASPRASEMLLKLADLLSYMLYECDRLMVPLDKEIEMMKGYMELEKIRQAEKLEVELNVSGDLQGKQIPPFLLLPFIENSFRQIADPAGQAWINMEIKTEKNIFSMKLINGLPAGNTTELEQDGNGLMNVKKRLSLLYPGTHELKTIVVQEMNVVLLRIHLQEALEVDAVNYSEKEEESTTSYARQ
jgi:sensor histidine kinase YesM